MAYRMFFFLGFFLTCFLSQGIASSVDDAKIIILSTENHPFFEYLPEISKHRLVLILPEGKNKESDEVNYEIVRPIGSYYASGQTELEIRQISKSFKVSRIIGFGEFDILTAARLRNKLDIPGQNYESALAFRDKVRMKTLLHSAGIPVPDFLEVRNASDLMDFLETKGYPAVFKHRKGAGSLGTVILQDDEDLETLLKEKDIFNHYHQGNYEVETFIPGEMFHVDGVFYNGKVICSWPAIYVTQNIECTKGKYSSSHILSPDNELTGVLNKFSREVLNALPTPEATVFHLEVFVTPAKELYVCEIASRLGGGVNDNWIRSFGIDLRRELVRLQAGLSPSDAVMSFTGIPSILSGEIMISKKGGTVIRVPEICDLPFSEIYKCNIKIGERYTQAAELADAAAFFPLIIGDDESDVKKHIKETVEWFYSNTEWALE